MDISMQMSGSKNRGHTYNVMHAALQAIKRAGGTVLAAGAATPVLGGELFSFVSGDAGVSHNGGVITFASVAVNSGATGAQTLTAGKSYLVAFTVTGLTSGAVSIKAGSIGPAGVAAVANGAFTEVFSPTTSVGALQFVARYATSTLMISNISVKEILDYTYGNPPVRNYFDSAGTDILDSVTQVDQPVGLVLDAAGTVGPDRVTDGNNESALFAIQGGVVSSDTVARASAPGGGFAASSTSTTSASTAHRFYGISPMLAGKTYQLSGRFYVPTGGIGSFKIYDNADGSWFGVSSSTKDQWVPFSVIRTPKATNWDLGIGDNVANVVTAGQVAFWIDDLSITELTGNHATQATVGSKPTLRRGLVNQLTQSDFQSGVTDAPIRGGLVTASTLAGYGGALAIGKDGSTATYAYKAFTHTSGATYTFCAVVEMTDGLAPSWGAGGVSGGASPFAIIGNGQVASLGSEYVVSSLGGTLYAVLWSYVASGVNGNTGLITYAANNNRTFKVTRYGLFTGTVTAQQILASGGIPLTTTAPASSALGKYWWQFDPAAPGDFLQTSITTGNEGWVCAGVALGTVSVGHHLFGNGAASSADVGVWLRVPPTNNTATLLVSNGTTREIASSSVGPAFTGTPKVIDGGWDATTMFVAVDGVETSIPKTVNCTTSKTCQIGGSNTIGWYTNGGMSVEVICPTLPPAADRALIRKWVAKQQGQTL